MRRRYSLHKGSAKARGIPFEFSFEEWCSWWDDHGGIQQRWVGHGKEGGCMCRYGDVGAYAPDNVYLGSVDRNCLDAYAGNDSTRPVTGPNGRFDNCRAAAEASGLSYRTIRVYARQRRYGWRWDEE